MGAGDRQLARSIRGANAFGVQRRCRLAVRHRPYPIANLERAVRLAESALQREDPKSPNHPDRLNTFGAALYRAGRFEEAIRRLEKAIQARGSGHGAPIDWPFLAMAHHRLGQRDQAWHWLERLCDYQPSGDPDQFGMELVIRLLRREAEVAIRYDPIFPDDPFAH